jgi:rSAM/selenodomain-associated transferase 1
VEDALAIAIFARAPSPGRAKTRLIPLLGVRGAADFQAALLADAVRKVSTLRGGVSSYLFLAGRDLPVNRDLGDCTLVRQRGRGLGERLGCALCQLLRRHSAAIVIGTDSPLLAARILRQAWRELRLCDAVLGPCPDGGYYLIGLRRMSPGLFAHIRWGTPQAFHDTLENMLKRGFSCSILEPTADIDRPEDFRRLAKEFSRSAAARRAAPSVWKFVAEFHAATRK